MIHITYIAESNWRVALVGILLKPNTHSKKQIRTNFDLRNSSDLFRLVRRETPYDERGGLRQSCRRHAYTRQSQYVYVYRRYQLRFYEWRQSLRDICARCDEL